MSRPYRSKNTPAYCLHKSTGRAYVTLDGRPVYLGEYGTAESRERYDHAIGEWLANGRHIAPLATPAVLPTIAEILVAFKRHAEEYYRDSEGNLSREFDNYIMPGPADLFLFTSE